MSDKLALVVAVAKNGVIGKDGKLPWRYPEDLKHFKRVTLGHAVIMGRKTFDEVGKPLPDRRNIVVSRDEARTFPGCEVVKTVEEAIALARTTDEEPRIIGGAGIFAHALPLVTRMYLTEILRDYEGDTWFPAWDRSAFREVERRAGENPDVVFLTLDRTGP
jgi:dihydrofolate reductase